MGKQIFTIKGMMRDLDPAKSSNQYAYEIRNLRLTAQEDSTLLALTTEKGNTLYMINDSINGDIVGYCVLNNYIVIFTHDTNYDYIYRLEEKTSSFMAVNQLYRGDLGFTADTKIEAIGIYENENIQKVYWIDGVHQPRFINTSPNADTSKWTLSDAPFDFVPLLNMNEKVNIDKVPYSGMFNAGTIQYILTYYNRNGQQSASFYQSPINYIAHDNRGASPEDTVDNSFRIRIANPDTFYDYIRIYSVFRSSENGTPVCKKVTDIRTSDLLTSNSTINTFYDIDTSDKPPASYIREDGGDITIIGSEGPVSTIYTEKNIEDFFEYREGDTSHYIINGSYSIITKGTRHGNIIIRATNGESISVWIKDDNYIGINKTGTNDLEIKKINSISRGERTTEISYIEYIDNGMSGEVVDYSEILYAGGTNIIPSTMAQKNQTLFFGNYKTSLISEEAKTTIKNNSFIHFGYSKTPVEKGTTGSHYLYDNQLDHDAKDITTFKGGETYYFGIILQNENGIWTDVIPIGEKLNTYYPKDSTVGDSLYFYPVKAYISFNETAKNIINTYKAIKVVRLDTLPSVVCQGVLCPTVFSKNREDNSPYCQSSWFFRDIDPAEQRATREDPYVFPSHKVQNKHNGNIKEGNTRDNNNSVVIGEIQGASESDLNYYDTDISNLTDMDMFVDWNTLTLNSPDIEFGQSTKMDYKMRIVGILPITAGATSMVLTWSTPPKSTLASNMYVPIINSNISTLGYQLDLANFIFRDSYVGTDALTGTWKYPVYPWHRNGSLTAQGTPSGTDNWYALLDTKVMASLREAAETKYQLGPQYNITNLEIYQDDETSLLIEDADSNSDARLYLGSVDTVLTNSGGYSIYGLNMSNAVSEVTTNNKDAVRMRYKSTVHGVFSLKNYNNSTYILPNVKSAEIVTPSGVDLRSITPKAVIKAVLNNEEASLVGDVLTIIGMVSTNNFYVDDIIKVNNVGEKQINLFYITEVNTNSIKGHTIDTTWIEAHPEGDKINLATQQITNEDGSYSTSVIYDIYFTYSTPSTTTYYYTTVQEDEGVYLDTSNNYVPYHTTRIEDFSDGGTINAGGTAQIIQPSYNVNSSYNYLYLAELYTDSIKSDLYNSSWYVASEPVKVNTWGVEASIGDTYYQRYDCLKTYPYALEDQNQIVEIFSFMCETKVNIDGRYDKRRGLFNNTAILNTNFNLLNRGYTQIDNFISYHYLDPDYYNVNNFPNQITWTKTKVYGSDIDAWTQIVPTSTLDIDGTLGEIRALKLWNDNLMCFQDKGIAKIMYNERTTISTQQGVPVEIANSGKVDGSQYISNQIGCSNKESIQITQDGIYFIDSNTKEIYRWSQGLASLSKSKGFNTYLYNNTNIETEKTFYDPKLKDVYFKFGNECLVYNEQLSEFMSFLDYDMDFMFPYKDSLIAIKDNNLWKQFDGDYLSFFDTNKGYSIELVSAENPTQEKIFTNIEFRADVLNGSINTANSQATDLGDYSSINKLPFQTIRAWNEYQDTGEISFERMLRKGTNLSQRFRVWRGDIGRDTLDSAHKFNRISNPWVRIKLSDQGSNKKTVVHDIAVTYF